MDQQLPTFRPAPGTKTGRVWDIADGLTASLGRLPRVSEVARAYATEGGHPGTGQVQYYAWKNSKAAQLPRTRDGADDRADLAAQVPKHRSDPDAGGAAWLSVEPDGRLDIPPALIDAMRLDGSMKVHAEVVDGELRLVPLPLVIERIQAFAARLKRDGESVVDEFIAERRAEAARE